MPSARGVAHSHPPAGPDKPLAVPADATQPGAHGHGKGGAVSGAVLITISKLLSLIIGLGATAVIARLVSPADYGLVAMVVSVTALLNVPSDFGLSLVTIQKPSITQEQLSTLFWVNLGIGTALGLVTCGLAPALAWFYQDPRVLPITLATALVFPGFALGVQHEALVKRHMLFRRLACIRLASTGGAAIAGVTTALAGWGYWALVCQTLGMVVASTGSSWLSYRWLPGRPRRCPELRQMLGFGGCLTAHGITGYFSQNMDKVLLGRFVGAYALGLYSTSYMLMSRAMVLSSYTVGEAAIPAMSRVASDPARLRSVYRRMFQFSCLLGLPLCVAGVVWAGDAVAVLLGPKWTQAVPILSMLCLAVVPRMLLACTGWVYVSTGRPGRMLRWQLLYTPAVVLAFAAGLPWGALGVAAGYAVVNWLALVPGFAYCFGGSVFKASDAIRPAVAPLGCTLAAITLASLAGNWLAGEGTSPGLHLGLKVLLFTIVYTAASLATVPLVREGFGRLLARLRARRASVRLEVAAAGD